MERPPAPPMGPKRSMATLARAKGGLCGWVYPDSTFCPLPKAPDRGLLCEEHGAEANTEYQKFRAREDRP